MLHSVRFVDSVLRLTWTESKWYFKNKIRYTFKLEAYGKLFHFDNQGLKERAQCANSGIHRTAAQNSLGEMLGIQFPERKFNFQISLESFLILIFQ